MFRNKDNTSIRKRKKRNEQEQEETGTWLMNERKKEEPHLRMK